jgi:hypothetical protein
MKGSRNQGFKWKSIKSVAFNPLTIETLTKAE